MGTTVRTLGASIQIGLAAAYVHWVILPGHSSTDAGLGLWALALAVSAIGSEVAWRRGRQGDLSAVARIAGLLMLVVALSLFVVTLGLDAMVPSLDF